MQSLNNVSNIQIIDPNKTVEEFVTRYYKEISNNGWSQILYLFSNECVVLFKNKNVGNELRLFEELSKEYIKRVNITNMNVKWVQSSNNTIVINVFGTMQYISMFNTTSQFFYFTETFVLTLSEGPLVKCTSHMFDF